MTFQRIHVIPASGSGLLAKVFGVALQFVSFPLRRLRSKRTRSRGSPSRNAERQTRRCYTGDGPCINGI